MGSRRLIFDVAYVLLSSLVPPRQARVGTQRHDVRALVVALTVVTKMGLRLDGSGVGGVGGWERLRRLGL